MDDSSVKVTSKRLAKRRIAADDCGKCKNLIIYYIDMRDKITFDTTIGAYCLVEWDEDGNPRNVVQTKNVCGVDGQGLQIGKLCSVCVREGAKMFGYSVKLLCSGKYNLMELLNSPLISNDVGRYVVVIFVKASDTCLIERLRDIITHRNQCKISCKFTLHGKQDSHTNACHTQATVTAVLDFLYK